MTIRGCEYIFPKGGVFCTMSILSRISGVVTLAVAALMYGQSITGDLVVNVTDPSGSVVSGAKLSLVQVETNVHLEAKTDALGNYLFSQLKPGRFALEVSGRGFQKTNLTDIVISLGQRARVDVKLTVGTLTETVNVSAAAETLLNAESASVGQVITSAPIVELPLNGRNFIQLAQISAGAAPIGIGTSPATSWTGRSDSTLSIAGGRETNNSFLVKRHRDA
ncbi:MAG: carboxypeptidase-like regulatory domain-containing protein [Thermoanaerobaculia bacterium]